MKTFIIRLITVTLILSVTFSLIFGQPGTCPNGYGNLNNTKNCFIYNQNFAQRVTLQSNLVQKGSALDSLLMQFVTSRFVLNYGNNILSLGPQQVNIGNATEYTIGAGLNNIDFHQANQDTILITFSGDTAQVNGQHNVVAWKFTPKLDANSVTGFWETTGNSGTTASNFIGTTDAVDFIAKTNNSERLRITSAGNVAINNSTAKAKLQVKGANTDGYSFLLGDSATDAGGKTFVANKSFFGLTVPSIRNGYVGDLSMIGLGDGTNFWNSDSIGVGSVVIAGLNDKASGTNAQVYGGAANVASGSNSLIIGGLSNTASSSTTTIVNSSSSSATDTNTLVISSGNSNATGNNATIISSLSTNVSGQVSGALLSADCQIAADYSIIMNSSDCHIDFDTNGTGNTIIGSTLCGIDGNARLATALGSYKTTLNGTHSVSLSAAYAESYAYHELLIGNSPVKDSTGNAISWVAGDMLIGVGNAIDSTTRQNSLMMIKNGNTVIGPDLGLADKPLPTSEMFRVKGDVKIDSLLTLGSLDSVTIYLLTPPEGTLIRCNDCTGNGLTSNILAYISAMWRRLF